MTKLEKSPLGLGVLLGLVAGLVVGWKAFSPHKVTQDPEGFVKSTVYAMAGTVDSVAPDSIVIRQNDRTMKIAVNKETKITLVVQGTEKRSLEATISSRRQRVKPKITRDLPVTKLQTGDQLTIKAERSGGQYLARTIVATRRSSQ